MTYRKNTHILYAAFEQQKKLNYEKNIIFFCWQAFSISHAWWIISLTNIKERKMRYLQREGELWLPSDSLGSMEPSVTKLLLFLALASRRINNRRFLYFFTKKNFILASTKEEESHRKKKEIILAFLYHLCAIYTSIDCGRDKS